MPDRHERKQRLPLVYFCLFIVNIFLLPSCSKDNDNAASINQIRLLVGEGQNSLTDTTFTQSYKVYYLFNKNDYYFGH